MTRWSHAGIAALLVLLGGCGGSAPADAPEHALQQRVRAAYDVTKGDGRVSADVVLSAQAGTNQMDRATGRVCVDLRAQGGVLRTDSVIGAGFAAIRKGAQLRYRARARNGQSPGTWTAVDLATASGLPELASPGLDPLQAFVVLAALERPETVRGIRLLAVADGQGQHDEYQVSVDLQALAPLAPASERNWLSAMAKQPLGRYITVSLRLEKERLYQVVMALPVKDATVERIPEIAGDALRAPSVTVSLAFAEPGTVTSAPASRGTTTAPALRQDGCPDVQEGTS